MQLKKQLNLEMPEGIDEGVGILQLTRGTVDGKDFWAYLSMYPSLYDEYNTKVEAGELVNLEDYGKTLEKGWGKQPPQDIHNRMVADYGIDMNFENDLKEAMKNLQLAGE